MNCREVEKYIYLGEEIPADNTLLHEFQKHLQTCAECRRKYKEMHEYSSLVSRIRDVEFTSELQDMLSRDIIRSIKSISRKHSSPK